MNFHELSEFIDHKMRMSHVYQPVMLKALLTHDGVCSEETIGRTLLGHDRSQIEYYGQVTRNMVGRVLRNHSIVERNKATKNYELLGFDAFTADQVKSLIAKCDSRLGEFIASRGDQPWKPGRWKVSTPPKRRCSLERKIHKDRRIIRFPNGT